MTVHARAHINLGMLTAHISRRAAGVWEVIQNLTNVLSSSKRISPSVWGLRAPDTEAMFSRLDILDCSACDVTGPQSFGFAPNLMNRVKAVDIDLLHNHGAWMYPSLVSYRWGKKTRKPVIISPHGMLDPWAVKKASWKKRIVSTLFETNHFKTARCFHALCIEEALAIRSYGIKRPICVVPNGVTLPEFKREKPAKWVQDRAGGRKILLYLGRLHPKKGLENLIRAFALFKSENGLLDDWILMVAGDNCNQYGRFLEGLRNYLGLENDVRFLGAQYDTKKTDLFASANAFVLPSLSEGLPVAVLEAWSHSLPCLITPSCHLSCGYKYGAALKISYRVEDIYRGLEDLFSMSDRERRQMGARGRRLVETQYSWDQVSQKMLSVYEWCLGGPYPSNVEVL